MVKLESVVKGLLQLVPHCNTIYYLHPKYQRLLWEVPTPADFLSLTIVVWRLTDHPFISSSSYPFTLTVTPTSNESLQLNAASLWTVGRSRRNRKTLIGQKVGTQNLPAVSEDSSLILTTSATRLPTRTMNWVKGRELTLSDPSRPIWVWEISGATSTLFYDHLRFNNSRFTGSTSEAEESASPVEIWSNWSLLTEICRRMKMN